MAEKKKTTKSKSHKPHVCHDMLPKNEAQLLEWAEIAKSINPHNAPEFSSAATAALLSSVCVVGSEDVREFTPLDMASLTTARWKVGDEITFGFMRASERIATHVRDAVETLKPYVNLKFREVDASVAKVRITDFEQGAYSYLGVHALGIPRNQETMNLARSWADLATTIHEWCHALSMIHEHQSPARPDDFWNEAAVYRAYGGPPNNWPREQVKSNVIDRYSKDSVNYTELDLKSIMLYPLEASLLKNPSFATGWNKKLSDKDKEFLQKIYPFPDAPPPPPPDSLEVVIPRSGKWVYKTG
jgi:hypothetical protein